MPNYVSQLPQIQTPQFDIGNTLALAYNIQAQKERSLLAQAAENRAQQQFEQEKNLYAPQLETAQLGLSTARAQAPGGEIYNKSMEEKDAQIKAHISTMNHMDAQTAAEKWKTGIEQLQGVTLETYPDWAKGIENGTKFLPSPQSFQGKPEIFDAWKNQTTGQGMKILQQLKEQMDITKTIREEKLAPKTRAEQLKQIAEKADIEAKIKAKYQKPEKPEYTTKQALSRLSTIDSTIARMKSSGTIDTTMAIQNPALAALVDTKDPEAVKQAIESLENERNYVSKFTSLKTGLNNELTPQRAQQKIQEVLSKLSTKEEKINYLNQPDTREFARKWGVKKVKY